MGGNEIQFNILRARFFSHTKRFVDDGNDADDGDADDDDDGGMVIMLNVYSNFNKCEGLMIHFSTLQTKGCYV